jgi:hypothetical protein
LSGVSDNERPIADDRSCLRRRQTGRIDAEPAADLVFGKKILLQRIMLRIVLDAGLRARQASLPIDPRKRKRPLPAAAPSLGQFHLSRCRPSFYGAQLEQTVRNNGIAS